MCSMKTVILISGKARSGKDFISERLMDYLGRDKCLKVALADELKVYLSELLGVPIETLDRLKNTEESFCKNGTTVRQMLQRLGSDIFVEKVDKYYWVKQVSKVINNSGFQYYVVPDFRHAFETSIADYTQGVKVKTIRIISESRIKSSVHESEKMFTYNFDKVINNTDYSYDFDEDDFKFIKE